MIAVLVTGLAAFVAALLVGDPVIKKLIKLKFGQEILEIGPSWHAGKRGTPTMGGVIFIFAIAVGLCAYYCMQPSRPDTGFLVVLFFAAASGLIGLMDDYTKIVKKRNLGLTALQKSALLVLFSIVFSASIYLISPQGIAFPIPFTGIVITLDFWLYLIISAFLLTGFVNAVNLTDGLDGLAAGTMIPIAVFFTAAFFFKGAPAYAALSAALAGGLLGFLIFNFYPAKVFMGDTGALFLGGMLCGLSYALQSPLLLFLVGFIFFLEALSVILQVGYFKLTGGKRLFKMAPLHHHFEKCGIHERVIMLLASIFSVLLSTAGFLSVYFS